MIFSGGGARGAYEAGVIRYLVDELPRRLGRVPQMDILCGTSVGAVHACFIAGTADAEPRPGRGDRLVDFWRRMKAQEILPFSTRDLLGLRVDIYGLPEDSLDTFRGRVRAATSEDVARAANDHLHPERAAIVLVGPAKELEAQLKDLGPIEIVTP